MSAIQKSLKHNTKINIDKSNHQRYKKGLAWLDFPCGFFKLITMQNRLPQQ